MIRCAIELHKDLNSYPSSTPRRHNFGTYRTYHQQQQQQISLAISSTKLSELKDLLANEEHFGAKAPVRRQRLFYLGRELKSGGRSLCNLGLGKFNNRILHLCIRPAAKGDEAKDAITKNSKDDDNNNNSDADADANALEEEGSTAIGGRKRSRAGESALSTSTQQYTTSRQRYINSNITAMNDIDDDDDRIDAGNNNDNEYGSSSTSRSVVTSTTSIYSRIANNTNLAIDLVDSSSDDDDEVDDNDDDDVEIIEIN
jgi:hypothetical protein